MLAILSLDSVSLPLIERLESEGQLPHLAELRRRGRTLELMDELPGAAYATLYTGRRLADHGVHFPLQWSAPSQSVRPSADPFAAELDRGSLFARLSACGRKVLVLDPPECPPHSVPNGILVSGFHFRARILLPEWSRPTRVGAALVKEHGRGTRVDEVFGRRSAARMMHAREALVRAPSKLSAATKDLLRNGDFDLLWVTFAAAHQAGHLLWDLSLVEGTISAAQRQRLEVALVDVYTAVDAAIGEIVSDLPPGADVVIFSGKGMGPNTSRIDLLPGMLNRILGGSQVRAAGTWHSPLWRLRSILAPGFRARLASALPEPWVVPLMGRLETFGRDWNELRAFVPPCDVHGFVRLNLQGRERDGIVPRDAADDLLEEISMGLKSFSDMEGGPAVEAIETARQLAGSGEHVDWLPDLIVHWSGATATLIRGVTSPQFGDVLRNGVGTGRTGNHCSGGWVTLAPGGSRLTAEPSGPSRLEDISATICSVLGAPSEDLPGRPLLVS